MAKEKRPAPAPASSAGPGRGPGPGATPAAEWDEPYGPRVPDAPAGDSMPPRAARLASQNGPAMRHVFAYLLDEDPAPLPPPPAKKRR